MAQPGDFIGYAAKFGFATPHQRKLGAQRGELVRSAPPNATASPGYNNELVLEKTRFEYGSIHSVCVGV